MRAALWPSVRELAEAPDLLERAVQQVQSMGVVNEDELIKLIYLAAISRVSDPADQPGGEGRQQRRKILHDVAHFRFDRFGFRELPDKQQRAVLGI